MIGDRLRAIRESKQLTQEKIAECTGLLEAYVSLVECGEAIPSIDKMELWARALQVPMHKLFYDGEEPPLFPNLPDRLTADDIVNGNSRNQAGVRLNSGAHSKS
jgi:transcriptional regulator with XRE-family HTH domain